MDMSWAEQWRELNRALWDERVPIHAEGKHYDLAGFVAGRSSLREFEPDELGAVEGLTLIHPQCHIGLDTLSWARRGARVTGLDFSEPAMSVARELAGRIGVEAEFIVSDVYDSLEAVGGRQFDIVYTGIGALNWLPDIERWAAVMAGLLAPGGRFYMVELHPITEVFGDEDLTIERSYFERGPLLFDEPGTYADPEAATSHTRSVERIHGLGDVVSALIGAGLRLEFLHEQDYTASPRFPFLEPAGDGTYRMPKGRPALPLMYSLRARR
jgi:SAM-dependent methyltransferase